MNFILADNQDITRLGLEHIIERLPDVTFSKAEDKAELMFQLREKPSSIVILDYTLSDFPSADDLLILLQRFENMRWVMFSEDLSIDFVKQLTVSSSRISIILKESPASEIKECLKNAMADRRYICQRMAELLLTQPQQQEEKTILTKTETEILISIAQGLTTREIAEQRFSSFHTVNTHRKNIFRKIQVNNAHEATKYAVRAGLVDAAEYYI